jgi:hypothetical protein
MEIQIQGRAVAMTPLSNPKQRKIAASFANSAAIYKAASLPLGGIAATVQDAGALCQTSESLFGICTNHDL